MAKNGVEGVYTADPRTHPEAEFIAEITHRDALSRGLKVMDSTALSLCMDKTQHHAFHSNITVANGPRSITMDCARP